MQCINYFTMQSRVIIIYLVNTCNLQTYCINIGKNQCLVAQCTGVRHSYRSVMITCDNFTTFEHCIMYGLKVYGNLSFNQLEYRSVCAFFTEHSGVLSEAHTSILKHFCSRVLYA